MLIIFLTIDLTQPASKLRIEQKAKKKKRKRTTKNNPTCMIQRLYSGRSKLEDL